MTTPVKHRGAGIDLVPELLIREILIQGFLEFVGDDERMDELLGRIDALHGGSQSEWAGDLKAALLRMAQPDGGLLVGVGYPHSQIPLPYVSVVLESGAENTGEAAAGDVLSRSSETIGTLSPTDPTVGRVVEHTTVGMGWTSTVQIGSWSRAPEESTLLHSVVRSIMLLDKGRLTHAGAHEIGFSESGFQPQTQEYPDTGYVPVLRCTIGWTLRVTRRRSPVPTRISARGGGSFGN